jgi:hypothetical protein
VTTPQVPDVVTDNPTADILAPDTKPGNKARSKAYRAIKFAGVTPEIANSLRRRATVLAKDDTGVKFRTFAKHAMILHALMTDFKARNAADVDELKAATDVFIKISQTLRPKTVVKK